MIQHVSDAVAITEEMLHQRGLIAFRHSISADPAALHVSGVDREGIAFVLAGGESRPGVLRIRGRMRAPVHPNRPRPLGNLAIGLNRDEPLGMGIAVFQKRWLPPVNIK